MAVKYKQVVSWGKLSTSAIFVDFRLNEEMVSKNFKLNFLVWRENIGQIIQVWTKLTKLY